MTSAIKNNNVDKWSGKQRNNLKSPTKVQNKSNVLLQIRVLQRLDVRILMENETYVKEYS